MGEHTKSPVMGGGGSMNSKQIILVMARVPRKRGERVQ